jgi:hypothetical protein
MADQNPIRFDIKMYLFATAAPHRGLFRLLPPATRAELWAGLVLIGLSLLGTAWLLKCRSDTLALEQDSVTVKGRVLRLWITTGKGASFHVAYEYPASTGGDAQVFRNEIVMSEKRFDALKEGGPIAVMVCSTNPANHQVVGERPRTWSSSAAVLLYLGFLALLTLAGVVNLGWWWVSCRKPGRMNKKNPPWKRYAIFTCRSCGRVQ